MTVLPEMMVRSMGRQGNTTICPCHRISEIPDTGRLSAHEEGLNAVRLVHPQIHGNSAVAHLCLARGGAVFSNTGLPSTYSPLQPPGVSRLDFYPQGRYHQGSSEDSLLAFNKHGTLLSFPPRFFPGH